MFSTKGYTDNRNRVEIILRRHRKFMTLTLRKSINIYLKFAMYVEENVLKDCRNFRTQR